MTNERTCSECGCTDLKACPTPAGPCSWVGPALCSACDSVTQRRRSLAIAAAHAAAEAAAELLRYAREGDGIVSRFELDPFGQLLDAAKITAEIEEENPGGGERQSVYLALVNYLEGWA